MPPINMLKKMKTSEVWEAFRHALDVTAGGMMQMAECWVELVSRGENMTSYQNPMFSFLPDVASGKLLPDVLLRYGGTPSLTTAIAALVPEDQKKLTRPDARVAVAMADGTTRRARITDLKVSELRQVLGDGRIRTVSEQQRHLAPPQRVFGSRASEAAPINSDFDLYAIMTADQRKQITALAEAVGMTPAEFTLDDMVRHRTLRGRPIDRKRASSIRSVPMRL